MRRHLTFAALFILLVLTACSRSAAGLGQAPFEPYLRDDNGGSHGDGGEGMM
jgi:hypothetical protein